MSGQTYLLRDVPRDVWVRARRRAAESGIPMRTVLISLLRQYAEEGAGGEIRLARPKAIRKAAKA